MNPSDKWSGFENEQEVALDGDQGSLIAQAQDEEIAHWREGLSETLGRVDRRLGRAADASGWEVTDRRPRRSGRSRVILFVAVSLALTLVGGGVGYGAHFFMGRSNAEASTPSPAPRRVGPAVLGDEALVEKYDDAVYRLETSSCAPASGSAFAVDDHHLITNWHVVATDRRVLLTSHLGNQTVGEVVHSDFLRDLAVVRTDALLLRTIDMDSPPDVRKGTHLVALGYPVPDLELSPAPGSVLGLSAEGIIRSNLPADAGSSGGPALTSSESLAGIVVGAVPGVTQLSTILLPAAWARLAHQDALDGRSGHQPISCEEQNELLGDLGDRIDELEPEADIIAAPDIAARPDDTELPEPPVDEDEPLPSNCYHTGRSESEYACEYVGDDGAELVCYFDGGNSYCESYEPEPAPSTDPNSRPSDGQPPTPTQGPSSGGNCHASYPDFCIPPSPPDLNCADVGGTDFTVRHDVANADPHGFDGDNDGVGCEA